MRPSDAVIAAKSEANERFGSFSALEDGRPNPRVSFGFASMVIVVMGDLASEYAKAVKNGDEFNRFDTKYKTWAHRMAEHAFASTGPLGIPVPGDPDEQLAEEHAAAFWDACERLAVEMVDAPDGTEFGWEDFTEAVNNAPAVFAGYVEGIVEGAADLVGRAVAAGIEGATKGIGSGLWGGIGPWTFGTVLVLGVAYLIYRAKFKKGGA